MDNLFCAVYNKKSYNCFHFARDVWRELTGGDSLIGSPRELRSIFERIKSPIDPCLVVFTGGRDTHIGVYFEGRVMHLTESGVSRERLASASVGFKKVSFYREKA